MSGILVESKRILESGGEDAMRYSRSTINVLLATCFLTVLIGAAGDRSQAAGPIPEDYEEPDKLMVVDCLLPGQVRRLGRQQTYLTPRRPAKLTAGECEIRGGEYVAWDRANWETSLRVWLARAEEGDPTAQTYVGEIYEKGLGREPAYADAAKWYRLAAEQNYSRAQMNLGYLYERGLGVDKDAKKALDWYRAAIGLVDDELTFTSELERQREEASAEIVDLKEQLSRSNYEAATLREQLEKTQSQLEARKLDVAVAEARLAEARSRMDSAEPAELERLKSELQGQELQVAQQKQDISALEKQTASERQQLAAQLTSAQENEKQLSEELRRQTEETEALRKELVATRVKLEETENRLARLREEYKAQSELLAGQKQALEQQQTPALAQRVQQQETRLDQQAESIERLEAERKNYEEVIADRSQQLATRSFELEPALQVLPDRRQAGEFEFGNYYALIIGNNDYQHLPKLQTPVNDAQAVARVLKERYDYQATLLINADRQQILKSLNQFVKRLGEDDNLLIYYAGHGQLDDRNKRGYWLPVDAERDETTEWIADRAITEHINLMKAKHVLVVADSCYSGSMTRTSTARLTSASASGPQLKRMRLLAKLPSRTVLTSGGEKPVLDAGGGSHSVFARSFLEILRRNDRILEGKLLYARVYDQVTFAAGQLDVEQKPEYSQIADAGHLNGEFLFVPNI